jgi:hypothetical protein
MALIIIQCSFKTNKFSSFLEICTHVQEFIFKSKYNLKRNSMANGKTITFVCSCISKKEAKGSRNNKEESEDEPKCKRKVKRHNIEPCRFRLKFKLDKKNGTFILHRSSNFDHNHPPQDKVTEEVSRSKIISMLLLNFLFSFCFFYFSFPFKLLE